MKYTEYCQICNGELIQDRERRFCKHGHYEVCHYLCYNKKNGIYSAIEIGVGENTFRFTPSEVSSVSDLEYAIENVRSLWNKNINWLKDGF